MDGQRGFWWFDGSTYRAERPDDPGSDRERLSRQLEAVRLVMSDGQWHTLAELADQVGGSEAGCSARLRDFRKPRFGAWVIERRYVSHGLHEYRMTGERTDG